MTSGSVVRVCYAQFTNIVKISESPFLFQYSFIIPAEMTKNPGQMSAENEKNVFLLGGVIFFIIFVVAHLGSKKELRLLIGLG